MCECVIIAVLVYLFYQCYKQQPRRNDGENASVQLPEFREAMSERRRQPQQQEPPPAVAAQPEPPHPSAPMEPSQPSAPTERTEDYIRKQLFFRSLEDGESVRSLEKILAAANDRYEANTDGNFLVRSYRAASSSVRTLSAKPECCICLDGYDADDVVCWAKTDECDHLFHDKCIIEWLKDHDDCPLCRANLMIVD